MRLEYKYNGLTFDITEFIESYISIDRETYINAFEESNKIALKEISNIINPQFQKWLKENDLLGSNLMGIYRDFNACIINKLQDYK
jgi:hypothetical protein